MQRIRGASPRSAPAGPLPIALAAARRPRGCAPSPCRAFQTHPKCCRPAIAPTRTGNVALCHAGSFGARAGAARESPRLVPGPRGSPIVSRRLAASSLGTMADYSSYETLKLAGQTVLITGPKASRGARSGVPRAEEGGGGGGGVCGARRGRGRDGTGEAARGYARVWRSAAIDGSDRSVWPLLHVQVQMTTGADDHDRRCLFFCLCLALLLLWMSFPLPRCRSSRFCSCCDRPPFACFSPLSTSFLPSFSHLVRFLPP